MIDKIFEHLTGVGIFVVSVLAAIALTLIMYYLGGVVGEWLAHLMGHDAGGHI